MPRRLDEYDSKRDFDSTPEPTGDVAGGDSGRLFVIHKHAASRMHYDLRLEHDGVLMSWAVPKGPSLDTKQRRLAVHVEDHPIEYGSFEGVIPQGEYGGGTVMLWETGTWEPHGDVDEGISAGKLVFELDGQKLQGRFGLIHTGARKEGRERNQWLLIKERDDWVRSHEDYDVTAEKTLSVSSGRTMDEIASAVEWAEDVGPSLTRSLGSLEGAIEALIDEDPRPQLPSPSARIPDEDGWIHEIKHDGYRLMITVADGAARVSTREGKDWTERFLKLAAAAEALPVHSAIIDCEAVVVDSEGVSDFPSLQRALSGTDDSAVVAYCFDIPYLDGYDLKDVPLLDRKELLRSVLSGDKEVLLFSGQVTGGREAVLSAACELGAEGIVSKRADSKYRPGRSKSWLKSKCSYRQEFLVVGMAPSNSGGLGSLLLAYHDGSGGLRYAGKVGTGFDERDRAMLTDLLAPLRIDGLRLAGPPSSIEASGVDWLSPQVVVEVEFTEWTAKGRLRHPSFKGVREDLDPKAIARESGLVPDAPTLVAGVNITHPEREMVPDGPTKLELARYYEAASSDVLRHLAGRPMTLLRCPDGASVPCFWQRHVDTRAMPHVTSRGFEDMEFVVTGEAEGLVELVQYLTVEMHTWGSRAETPDRPDRMVFDLDPGPDVDWDTVRAAALLLRQILDSHGLVSFVKTSGGVGLHVVAPIVARVPVKEVALFSKAISVEATANSGDSLTIDPRKSARTGRIFIDWHRNGAAQSTVAAYSIRARSGGPVSTPVTWEELTSGIDPSSFTTDAVLTRLEDLGDPWEDMDGVEQHLPQEALPDI